MSWIARSSSFLYASSSCSRDLPQITRLALLDVAQRAEEQPSREVRRSRARCRSPSRAPPERDLCMDGEGIGRRERGQDAASLAEHEGRVEDRDVVQPSIQQVERRVGRQVFVNRCRTVMRSSITAWRRSPERPRARICVRAPARPRWASAGGRLRSDPAVIGVASPMTARCPAPRGTSRRSGARR